MRNKPRCTERTARGMRQTVSNRRVHRRARVPADQRSKPRHTHTPHHTIAHAAPRTLNQHTRNAPKARHVKAVGAPKVRVDLDGHDARGEHLRFGLGVGEHEHRQVVHVACRVVRGVVLHLLDAVPEAVPQLGAADAHHVADNHVAAGARQHVGGRHKGAAAIKAGAVGRKDLGHKLGTGLGVYVGDRPPADDTGATAARRGLWGRRRRQRRAAAAAVHGQGVGRHRGRRGGGANGNSRDGRNGGDRQGAHRGHGGSDGGGGVGVSDDRLAGGKHGVAGVRGGVDVE